MSASEHGVQHLRPELPLQHQFLRSATRGQKLLDQCSEWKLGVSKPIQGLPSRSAMLGLSVMRQERTYPGRVSGMALTNPDFARLIEACDGYGEIVQATAEFAPTFTPAGQGEDGGRRSGSLKNVRRQGSNNVSALACSLGHKWSQP